VRSLANGRHSSRKSPVAGAPIIAGLVPCNVIAEEILTDHPARYRAMIVESANPAHSLADSRKMRNALRALDFVVVIDVAMTETAREADYVLPTATQYEKAEATFFNFDFPENTCGSRAPTACRKDRSPCRTALVSTTPERTARVVEPASR
jgi:anaerobic selenocysteine-containing dehydrogenase